MQLITRKQWGAVHAAGFGARTLPADEAWLHHSATLAPDLHFTDLNRDGIDDDEVEAMRLLERIGQQRFGAGISYNLCVMPTGRLYEGCGVARVGAHTHKRNTRALGVLLVGNYSTTEPTPAALATLAHVLREGRRVGWLRRAAFTGGHRDAPGSSTACPGDALHRHLPAINAAAARPAPAPTPPATEDDDMAHIGPGSSKGAIRLLQRCLHTEVHLANRSDSPYWMENVDAVADGIFGPDTQGAVDAYRAGRVIGYPPVGCDGVTLALLLRYEPAPPAAP